MCHALHLQGEDMEAQKGYLTPKVRLIKLAEQESRMQICLSPNMFLQHDTVNFTQMVTPSSSWSSCSS